MDMFVLLVIAFIVIFITVYNGMVIFKSKYESQKH